MMRLTNRFAGPIVRLRKALRSIANGEDITELKLRSGDYWFEMADEFNSVMQRLSQQGQLAPPLQTEPWQEEAVV